jgi:hypothetical protein
MNKFPSMLIASIVIGFATTWFVTGDDPAVGKDISSYINGDFGDNLVKITLGIFISMLAGVVISKT